MRDVHQPDSRKPYGDGLAANFGVERAAHVVTRVLRHAELAVTELVSDTASMQVSDAFPRQDAYLICCQLREREAFEYFEDNRSMGSCWLHTGETSIRDLRRNPQAMVNSPLHSLMWFVPTASLNALADEVSLPHIDELQFDPTIGIADETIRHLSASVLPALKAPHQINRLFSDHISTALAAHLAHAYGGLPIEARKPKGGLAPWQVRRAKEILAADLAGATPLGDIAKECGLSPGHFARAFRKSTGLAPHAWLLRARVERAMTLLLQPDLELSEIALACGFADHSHFSRVFMRQIGQSPGAWRRHSIL